MNIRHAVRTYKLVLLAIAAVGFSASTALAFTNPTQSPPNGNVSAPLNVGTADQTKTGGLLNVYDLWVNGALGSTGGITAPQYCIATDCITSWPAGGASQWKTAGIGIYYDDGYVGIGGVPGHRLTLVGDSSSYWPNLSLEFDDTSAGGRVYNMSNRNSGGTGSGFYLSDETPGFAGNRTLLFVNASTDVGIGTTNPQDKLQVFGDVRVGTSGANGCVKNYAGTAIDGTCSSDARLKNVGGSVDSVLEKLSALDLVTFHWNNIAHTVYHNDTTVLNTGFIAQDVQKQFPELVHTDENGYDTLDYTTLGLYTTEAVKELSHKVDTQQQEIDALKAEIEILKNKIR